LKPLILPYQGIMPKIASGAFVAPSASIIGNVEIGTKSGVWFNVTIRGDVAPIRIGEGTNIQDGTTVHVTRDGHPTIIGNRVTIGHRALLHACTLEDNCFIGMGAIVMDDAVVESGAMVAAGALVTAGKRVLKGQLWMGSPAKHVRDLREEEVTSFSTSADNYIKHAEEYLAELAKLKGLGR